MIPATTNAQLARVTDFERVASRMPQVKIRINQRLHAGLYERTAFVPAGHVICGARIRIPTLLIINGDVSVTMNDEVRRITGYRIIPAEPDRKQVFYAHGDTSLTMLFATGAATVEEAENEFTDEADKLQTRIKGEAS